MSLKLLLPSFRARQQFVEGALQRVTRGARVPRILNLGAGEGDFDRDIKASCDRLDSCDINAEDIASARAANGDVPGIEYSVEDGQSLTFPSAAFDIIVTIDVIEHVDDAMALLREIVRVLKPGGTLIITGPHDHFPISYDPINYVLGKVGRRHFGIGAYGYGHTWLVDGAQLQGWLRDVGLSTIETHLLTKALAASVECYWGGLVQRILKANAANKAGTRTRGVRLRPRSDPPLLWVTDVLNRLDASLLAGAGDSVGIAMIAEKARG